MGQNNVVWELRPSILSNLGKDGTITLGQYGSKGPNKVTLSRKNPTVTGEEYGVYSEYLQRKVEDPKLSDQKENLMKLKARQSSPPTKDDVIKSMAKTIAKEVDSEILDDLVSGAKSDESEADELDETSERLVSTEADGPEEPDDLPLEKEPAIPTVDEIKTLTREELEEKAKYLGVWDDIEGKGRDGYRKSSDIKNHLIKVISGLDESDEFESDSDDDGDLDI
jgi:hypothetical protein